MISLQGCFLGYQKLFVERNWNLRRKQRIVSEAQVKPECRLVCGGRETEMEVAHPLGSSPAHPQE